MKTFSRLAIFLFPVILAVPVNHASAQDWQLVWADEFDGSEVDTTKWAFQLGDGCPDLCGWGNGEEQFYTSSNAVVDGGLLKVEVRREDQGGRSYTSSRLRTLGKASWRYGRIELRAKMPRGVGFWPAVWMLPSDEVYGNWAASGEIDILEVFGNDAATVHGTLHFGGVSPRNTFQGGSFTLPLRDFSRAFHDFAIEWVPGEMRWYVDGTLYHTQRDWYTTESRFPAPFDQEFHLLVNVAVGGAGGDPSDTTFPQRMDIEHIRVFQSENTAPSVVLDSPADGSQISPGSAVTIEATAADTDGTVSRVVFYAGDAAISVDEAAPFEVTIEGVVEGCYTVRAKAIDNLGGETWTPDATVTVGSCVQAPYAMVPPSAPGRIQGEHFDLGGEGEAYHDLDNSNAGNARGNEFRTADGVDIDYALGSDQGLFVSDFAAGEWLEYQIDVAVAGPYNLDLRARSEAGATASLLSGSTVLAAELAVTASADGSFSTVRAANTLLEAGVQTLRVQVNDGSLEMDHVTINAYVEPPSAGTFIFDDFADLTGASWGYFGDAQGTVTTGSGVNPFMRATYSGVGGTGGAFYGVMWNNLSDASQVPIPADPWFNIRVRHSSTATTVESYTLEVTVREDADGNGWTTGEEDSHRFDREFDASAFNDEWITISAPLSAFVNLGTGGNGILEIALDEVVLVVSQVTGPNPSSVQVDFDDIIISTGPVGTGVSPSVPRTLALQRPYPNPTSGPVQLSYDLDEPGTATVQLFDVLGRQVLPPSKDFRAPGRHWLNLDLSQLSPGVYFVRLDAAGATRTQRVVVSR
ncbi:MAG: beta-glucanase (GH16 family) [Rhodothermales bacterium]|jgi:beta-glucanase (GH16 family)